MKREERYCTNCREPLPAGAAWCEKCGTDAGDIFDGRMPRRQSSSGRGWIVILLLIILVAGAAWFYRDKIPIRALHRDLPRTDTGPIRVVRQRPGGERRAPGAKISEPEAIITLRRYLTSRDDPAIRSECLAIASRGRSDDGYALEAFDSCKGTTLGRWRVDGRTGEVGR